MPKHRISYVSDIDGKTATRTVRNETEAKALWVGMTSRFVRYALWTELTDVGIVKGIRGELHGKFYFGAER